MSPSILAQAIRDTLLEEGRLSLPGIGTLQLRAFPARLVRTESRLYPPRKSPVLEAAQELSPPSDRLSAHYARLSGLPLPQAEAALVADFQDIRERLLEGRDVSLPEVGRFFVNERGETDFVASSFNYDLDMYGLGPVEARPVIKRSAAEAATEAIEARTVRPAVLPATRKRRRTNRHSRLVPLLVVLLIGAIATAAWLIYAPVLKPVSPVASVPEEEEDTPAAYHIGEEELREGSDIVEVDDEEAGDEVDEEDDLPVADARPVPPPDQWTHTIIVGHFADPNNVRNALDRIGEMGMQGDSRSTASGLTRVMVRVHAEYADPEAVLALIRDVMEPKAWMTEALN